MKTHRPLFGILAALLAVIMPLEQAHCAWMNLQPSASTAGERGGDHSCCASSTAQPKPAPASTACLCEKIPPAALNADIAFVSHPVVAALFSALPDDATALAPRLTRAPAPALDVGSPPLPMDPGAHGLRAPPLSA